MSLSTCQTGGDLGDVLSALVECRIRDASEPARQALARDLVERGVSARDIRLCAQRVVEVDARTKAEAARIVAAQLASAITWPAYVEAARTALRDHQERRAKDHEHGAGLRVTPEDMRRREHQACGLSEQDAHLIERGGYVHARVVGDDRVVGDVCREVGLDPWGAIQVAAWWADLCGGGRDRLQRAIERQVDARRCSDSLVEHLVDVPVRVVEREPRKPDTSTWRAKVRERAQASSSMPVAPRKLRLLTDQDAAEILSVIEAGRSRE